MSDSPHRSFETIGLADLQRLADLAMGDLISLFERSQHSARHRDRLLMLCLCQGAAEHYHNGDRGIKDFDVWAFFEGGLPTAFPPRRIGRVDFGVSRFGRNPEDGPGYLGRRIDVIGRSIDTRIGEPPATSVSRYLAEGRTTSAARLAQRPVIALTPATEIGKLIWEGVARHG